MTLIASGTYRLARNCQLLLAWTPQCGRSIVESATLAPSGDELLSLCWGVL